MSYDDFKDFLRTVSDKVSRDKAFNIAKNKKLDAYQRGFPSMIYNFSKKSLLVVLLHMKINLLLKLYYDKPVSFGLSLCS